MSGRGRGRAVLAAVTAARIDNGIVRPLLVYVNGDWVGTITMPVGAPDPGPSLAPPVPGAELPPGD